MGLPTTALAGSTSPHPPTQGPAMNTGHAILPHRITTAMDKCMVYTELELLLWDVQAEAKCETAPALVERAKAVALEMAQSHDWTTASHGAMLVMCAAANGPVFADMAAATVRLDDVPPLTH